MKAKLLIAIALTAVFLLPMGVLAEEDIEELPDAGIGPDSPFWGMDVAFDKLRYRFIMNKQERAKIKLEITGERLAEMKEMAEQNKTREMDKAQEAHQEMLNELQDDVDELENGNNTEENNITGIQRGMQNHIRALEKVMARIQAKENIPAATKEKLLNKFQNQIENANELQNRILNKKQQLALKQAQKKAQIGNNSCQSNSDCEDGYYCSTEDGDCYTHGNTLVCWGYCEEDSAVCCKITPVVLDPNSTYEWKIISTCPPSEDIVGANYEIVNNSFCEDTGNGGEGNETNGNESALTGAASQGKAKGKKK